MLLLKKMSSAPSLDISILLDFLKPKDFDSPDESRFSAQLTSLDTLSSICSESTNVDSLRNLNGLEFIWNLCCTSESLEVSHACLFTLSCAAQSNVYAQQDLCLSDVFEGLKRLLKSDDMRIKTKILAAYFLISLVSKNKQGQTLVCKSDCLTTLMDVFVECSKKMSSGTSNEELKEHLELWKVVTKALSYTVTVPKNTENQEKLCKILPWIVNGIHTTKNHEDLLTLMCSLLSVVVEDNKDCRERALQCKATEVLILVFTRYKIAADIESLGDAIAALNNLLSDEDGEHWDKFMSYGGSSLLLRLIEEMPSKKWETYHINQTMALLSKFVHKFGDKLDSKFYLVSSQKIIKLMSLISDDDCFNKLSIHLLNLFMEKSSSSKEVVSPNKPKLKSKPDNQIPLRRFSNTKPYESPTIPENIDSDFSNVKTCGMQSPDKTYFSNISTDNKSTTPPQITCKSFTTILLNAHGTRTSEVMLDISNSSREALRASSGILASPTDKVFQFPPTFKRPNRKSDCKVKNVFNDSFLKRMSTPKKLCRSRYGKKSSIRPNFSLETADNVLHIPKAKCVSTCLPLSSLMNISYQSPKKCNSFNTDDAVSLCGDIINKEVLHSVKKYHGLDRKGGYSGLLPRRFRKV